jgi:cell division protein FtsB
MARRRRKTKVTISLFPFLSILACVIGTLTLMITALALGQMDTDEMASELKLDYLKRQIARSRAHIEELKKKLEAIESGADELLKQLADAQVEYERLKRLRDSLLDRADEKVEPEIDVPVVDEEKHKKRIAQMQEELQTQEERKKELAAELEERGKPPEEAEVIIRPGGSGVDLEPTFVECAASGVVVYEGEEPWRVRRADLATDEKFLALLDRVADRPNATVVFLVRDDALGTYYAARNLARSHYARNGKLPVIGHGKIDLSMFEK